jgi:hypothetical protein
MESEPESSQRNQLVHDAPAYIRCPRCGEYYPELRVSFVNPQTGAHESAEGLHGCLISILAFFAILGVGIVIQSVLYYTLQPSTRVGILYIWFLVYLVGAIIAPLSAIPLYRAWRQNRLRKTHSTMRRFVCRQCKNEWAATQEPPAKQLP